jgi:16S rRNA (cytidine1402-2'-O)-methyltransferase
MSNSVLHLIPCPLAENALHTIPPYLYPIITDIKIWCVEDLRSARRFLKLVNRNIDIDTLTIYVINEHSKEDLVKIVQHFVAGETMGLLSDAGCPAVADPGSDLVALAHSNNVKIIPHVGPNSILLALMASGFNGQQFSFHGYLPIKDNERNAFIKKLEQESSSKHCTQIFIEAPYRNIQIFEAILKFAHPNTKLCIACDITGKDEYIFTQKIAQWKGKVPDINKKPAVFLLASY